MSAQPARPPRLPLPPPAVPLAKEPMIRRPPDEDVQAARKQPLPPNVAMARHQKQVALLEAYPGQLILRRSPFIATAYPAAAASRGHLVAGRIVLTATDGTRHKLRVWEAGARAPIELGFDDRMSFGGSAVDFGDDPISTVISLVVILLMVLASPVLLGLWLRRRHRRTRVAKCLLAVAQNDSGGHSPDPER